MQHIDGYLDAAEQIVREAGEYLKSFRAQGAVVAREKGSDRDFVTQADTTSQAMIASAIKARFPAHRFVGEEDELSDAQIAALFRDDPDAHFWIADPLDGTLNYIRGLSGYSVSLALVRAGQVLCGAIYAPVEDEMYLAQWGAGAEKNGAPMRASRCAQLRDAFLCTGVAVNDMALRARLSRLTDTLTMASLNLRMLGSAAHAMAHVASGSLDAYYEKGPHAWDFAAGMLMAREAGACAMDFTGAPLAFGRNDIVVCAPGIRDELMEPIARSMGR